MDHRKDGSQEPTLDPAILSCYYRRAEETRHERGLSQLEAVRTLELLMHPPGATRRLTGVADLRLLGGGMCVTG